MKFRYPTKNQSIGIIVTAVLAVYALNMVASYG